jgi:predicted protein tyrosine phosphatase
VGRGLKLLFVCSRNRWRSLTAEKIFDGANGIHARSAGTEPGARIRVTAGHLSWADLIFVMEKKHLRRLQEKFPEAIADKEIICLNIADDYELMQPELVDLLEAGVAPYLSE